MRGVLWVQGCTLACPGCFNPATHHHGGGRRVAVAEAVRQLTVASDIEGITISGGEPLQQTTAVAELLARIRSWRGLSTLLFTGYAWAELDGLAGSAAVLDHLDVLVTGRYRSELHLGHGLLGSANQTVHFLTSRYGPRDVAAVPAAEVWIEPDGRVTLSGLQPAAMRPPQT